MTLTSALLLWYPQPLFEAGGGSRFGVFLVAASALLGPVACFIPALPRGWRFGIQLALLGCGLFMVFVLRPVYLVFTLDRFDLVAAIDLSARDLAEAKSDAFRRRPLDGPRFVAAVLPTSARERDRLFDSSLAGKDLQRLPQYFVPYESEARNALKRAKPLAYFHARDPGAFDRFLETTGRVQESVRVLPLRAKKRDGVVLLDAVSGAPLAVLLVEPW